MKIEDLTVEMIKEMSDAEVILWHSKIMQDKQIAQMRKQLLDLVEIPEINF